MRHLVIVLSVFLTLITVSAFAQINTNEISDYLTEHRKIQQNGMVVLGSWALANFAASGYLMTQTSGKNYYFHQMNVFWNTVNLGIAVSGYLGAENGQNILEAGSLIKEYNNFSKILLLNTGLDIAYIATGFYLKERSKNVSKHQKRLYGYGNSLILQGGFLFLFDLALFIINESAVNNLLDSGEFKLSVNPTAFLFKWYF